jgi:hypothetical protein
MLLGHQALEGRPRIFAAANARDAVEISAIPFLCCGLCEETLPCGAQVYLNLQALVLNDDHPVPLDIRSRDAFNVLRQSIDEFTSLRKQGEQRRFRWNALRHGGKQMQKARSDRFQVVEQAVCSLLPVFRRKRSCWCRCSHSL